MTPVRLSEPELDKGICIGVKMETRGWLHKGGLIPSGNILSTMEARFLTVRDENYKCGREKTEPHDVGLELEVSV